MTNKEFRSDLAKEMRDKYDERNEQLEQIDKLPLTEPVKESAKKEIMDNFYKEMDEMKTRPWFEEARKTHLEEIKARIKLAKSKQEKERLQKEYEEKLAKADEDIAESTKGYEDAQIAHRGKIEQKITENKEDLEIPKKLADFRKKWEKNIDLDEDIKEKIIGAVNKIQKWAKEESDWSMLVEFDLWWKTYKTLDVNLEKHSDKKYLTSYEYNRQTKNEVKLWWMRWDDTKNWDNKELAEYVDKEKSSRKMEIRTVEFRIDLINKLWDSAGLTKMSDKIAMWMYLTWNYGYYWLTMWDDEKSNPKAGSRSTLTCADSSRGFRCDGDVSNYASLCLIACE